MPNLPCNAIAVINMGDDVWQHFTREVKPLNSLERTPVHFSSRRGNERIRPASQAVPVLHTAREQPLSLGDMRAVDSHLAQKLKRGVLQIDAVIDFHGLDTSRAHTLLHTRLQQYYRQQKRHILVITGKGSGILQQAVSGWLASIPYVLLYDYAPPQKGGTGALVVYLKRF
jgi:DNA-nicking Smr family endonuclease